MNRIASLILLGMGASLALAQAPGGRADDAGPGATANAGSAAGGARSSDAVPARRAVARSAAAKLSWRFREIRFEDMPLGEVLDNIARVFDVNIVVRWNRLAAVGIERDAGVSLSARNMRLSQVLWLVLNQLDGASVKLAYRADRDMILISTADDLGGSMVVKVYDIEDLVANRIARPTFSAERLHTAVTGVQPVVAAGAVGVRPLTQDFGTGIYLNSDDVGSDSPVNDEEAVAPGETTKEQRIQQLINVITTTIEPDSWAVNGGRGSIIGFRGRLVVRNSPFVHQQLGGALTDADAP